MLVVDITYFNQIKETTNQRIIGTSPVLNKMVFLNENKKAQVMSNKDEPWSKRYTGGRIKLKCKNCGEMITNHHYSWHMEACIQFFKHIRKIGSLYQCKICSNKVRKRVALYEHLRKYHPEEICQNKNASMNLKHVKTKCLEKTKPRVQNVNQSKLQNKGINITEITMKSENKYFQSSRKGKKGKYCVHCKIEFGKKFSDESMERHTLDCKAYSKLMSKVTNGYQCLVCSKQIRNEKIIILRRKMITHIKYWHKSELLNRSNKKDSSKISMNLPVNSSTKG